MNDHWVYHRARAVGYRAVEAWAVLVNYRRGFWHPCLGQKYTCWVGHI